MYHSTSEQRRLKHSRTEEEAKLDKSSQELAQAWEKFQKYLPESQRSSYKDRPPNFEDVAKAVANANVAWKEKQQTKLGKAKSLFANVCETMNDYKHVMAPIPSQDKYFSLLTGTFSVIVTVALPMFHFARVLTSNARRQ
jgi:hypothetical protein